MKHCLKCSTTKPLEGFHKNQHWCKPCTKEANMDWYKRNRGKALRIRRNGNLKRAYGITLEQYEDMLAEQEGLCAICRKPELGRTQYGVKNLAVDHCHKTGKVRGLLCQKCNRAIGQLHDDVESLKRAIEYIQTRS